ncbi:similar to Saccharomyces cerevisiae YLR215C CDC123 Protein involved in nutritional control of the cell cycle [Maudiozyma saulgeensis]|uniref:Translation initiation factor eIF2 assembly protein n=1 Tax=Maudiozyma saulgeensis TaxID=1789683 RepID=A0A1X7R2T2_9SACH|nr:similar to Saccharomyces cerevisiae YLR215C CDC123 Protein involved in nutritional control of the cell cycle [Kazachstania saulgeensis]
MTENFKSFSDVPVTRRQIENCSFSNWYPFFKDYTPKAEIIKPIPEKFVQYLEQDGISLPTEQHTSSFYTGPIEKNEENEYSDWEEDEEDLNVQDEDSSDEEDKESQTPKLDPVIDFPEFHNRLKSVLEKFGAVTPKLNWSAPQDATWILPNNSMKCTEVNELYLILNASNYIMHDLQYAFDDCSDSNDTKEKPTYELILRKWFDINPALEFRVFVKENQVVGVSQRDLNYYDYLKPLGDTFKDLIDEFVEDTVIPKFPDDSFVLDIYIPRPFDKIFLIDINPFAKKTDPLMFSWNELMTKEKNEEDDYELRLVLKNNTGRFACKEHSENQVPDDVVQASLDPNSIRELAEKWKELLAMQDKEETSH